jgi:hypothetical protein
MKKMFIVLWMGSITGFSLQSMQQSEQQSKWQFPVLYDGLTVNKMMAQAHNEEKAAQEKIINALTDQIKILKRVSEGRRKVMDSQLLFLEQLNQDKALADADLRLKNEEIALLKEQLKLNKQYNQERNKKDVNGECINHSLCKDACP